MHLSLDALTFRADTSSSGLFTRLLSKRVKCQFVDVKILTRHWFKFRVINVTNKFDVSTFVRSMFIHCNITYYVIRTHNKAVTNFTLTSFNSRIFFF